MNVKLIEAQMQVEGFDLVVIDYDPLFSIRWSDENQEVARAAIKILDEGIEWTEFFVADGYRNRGFFTVAHHFALANGPSRIFAAVPESEFYRQAGYVKRGKWLELDKRKTKTWLDARPT